MERDSGTRKGKTETPRQQQNPLDGNPEQLVKNPATSFDARSAARTIFIAEKLANGIPLETARNTTNGIMTRPPKEVTPAIEAARRLFEEGQLTQTRPQRGKRREPAKVRLSEYL